MPRRQYRKLEDHIVDVFKNDGRFIFQQEQYEVVLVDKPRPQYYGGECKTDVFVRGKENNSGKLIDLKISVKNENKEFLGNKLKSEDLDSYLGPGWEKVVIAASHSLRDAFENAILLYSTRKYPTCENSITVGWKLEITDKIRKLSVPIPLSDREIRDFVYKGTNQTPEKKNSSVDGTVIANSGVADYIIITAESAITCANDVIEQMELIDDADIGETFFVFTANNYRTDVDRADGPRSLAVRIEWGCENNKLVPKFCYDNPLHFTGERDMVPFVKEALRKLGKHNINELKEKIDTDLTIWNS